MPTFKDLNPLYAVNISFRGEPEQPYPARLGAIVKLLSGWHIVLKSGLMAPLLEEPPTDIDVKKKEAVVEIPLYEADLWRLHRFYVGLDQGDCEKFSLPNMHFKGGGIEDIGALQGGFYLPSIAREAMIDEKTRRFLEEKEGVEEKNIPR